MYFLNFLLQLNSITSVLITQDMDNDTLTQDEITNIEISSIANCIYYDKQIVKKLKIDVLKIEIGPRFTIFSDLEICDDPNIFILFICDEKFNEMIFFDVDLNIDPFFEHVKYKLFFNITKINIKYQESMDYLFKNYEIEKYDQVIYGNHIVYFNSLIRKVFNDLMYTINIHSDAYWLFEYFENMFDFFHNFKDLTNVKEKIINFVETCKLCLLNNKIKYIWKQSDEEYERDALLISKRFILLGQLKGEFHSYNLSQKKKILSATSRKWVRFFYKNKINFENVNRFLFAEIQGINNYIDRFTIFLCYFKMCNKKSKIKKSNDLCRILIYVWFYKSYWTNDRKQINEFLEVLYFATHPREQHFTSLTLMYDLSISKECTFHEMINAMIKRYLFFSIELKSLYNYNYKDIEEDKNCLELSWYIIVHAIGIKYKITGLET